MSAARYALLQSGQSGQALTEMLVVGTFVLVPLLFIIATLAKMISLKQDVELSARYAAWERTVWFQDASRDDLDGYGGSLAVRSDPLIAKQIDARILAADDAPIRSEDDPNYFLDAFLQLDREVDGELKPLADDDGAGGSVKHYARQAADESEPGGITRAMDDVLGLVDDVTRFDLNRKGLYSATVEIPLTDLSNVFELAAVPMDSLTLSRKNVLFAEPWTAGGNSHARRLISGLMPAQFLDNDLVEDIQALAAFSGISDELTNSYLDIGHVDIDPMPAYRLSEYGE